MASSSLRFLSVLWSLWLCNQVIPLGIEFNLPGKPCVNRAPLRQSGPRTPFGAPVPLYALVHHAPMSATHGPALPDAIASWLSLFGSVSKSPTFSTDRPRRLICGSRLLSKSEVQQALSRSFPSNISIRIIGEDSPACSNTFGSSRPISGFAPAPSNAATASEPHADQSGRFEQSAR